MKRKWIPSFITACALALGLHCLAADSALNHLPESTKWVLHADVTALKESAVGKFVMKELEKSPEAKGLDQLAHMLDFDVREDLEQITLFGPDGDEDGAVLVVKGNMDGDHLLGFIKNADGYKEETVSGVDVVSWIEDDGKRKGQRTYGHIVKDSYAVIGADQKHVAEALAALQGGRALAADNSLTKGLNKEAAVIVSAAANLGAMTQIDPDNALVRKAKSLQMFVQESGQNMVVQVKVHMKDAESAQQLLQIGQGGIAVLRMNGDKEPQLMKLLDRVRMGIKGDAVQVDVAVPSNEVIAVLKDHKDK